MKQQAAAALAALALCGGAHAQSNAELKATLEQAMKTIADLQKRVQVLEQQKAAPPVAPASAAAPAAAPAAAAATGRDLPFASSWRERLNPHFAASRLG